MPDQAALGQANDIFARYLEASEAGPVQPDAFFAPYPLLRPELDRKLNAYHLLQRVFFAIRQEASLRASLATASLHLEGQTLGDFQIINEIGRGGFGVIYLAKQISLDRSVAFKVLHPALVASASARERFIREGRAVAKLRHPHIASVHAAGEANGYAYLAMDLVTGVGLDDLIEELRKRHSLHLRGVDFYESLGSMLKGVNGALSMSTQDQHPNFFYLAARLMREVAAAIQHAHTHGIIHRDLKPSNILIDETAAPQLIDFGLSLSEGTQDLTLSTELFGSVPYLPPEQIETPKKHRPEAGDVYGLGVTFYELLTLAPAFQADTVARTIKLVLRNDPPLPRKHNPSIPPDLEAIVLKAMESSPIRRYASAQELTEDLDRFIQGLPVKARHSRWYSRAWKRMRRRPAALALVILLVGLAGLRTWKAFQEHELNVQKEAANDVFMGICKRGTNSYKEAIGDFTRAIKKNPKYVNAYVERAIARMIVNSDLEGAHQDLMKALQIDPTSGEANAILSILLLRQGDIAGANRLDRNILQSFPTNEFIREAYTNNLRTRNRLAWAIAGLEERCRADSKDVLSRIWLASLYQEKKDLPKALRCANEATALGAKGPSIWVYKTLILRTLGKRAEAEESVRTAVGLAPEDGNARSLLAELLDERGETDKAIDQYRAAAALLPENQHIWTALAYALFKTGRIQEAAEARLKSVAFGATDPNSLASLGGFLNAVGRTQQAAYWFGMAADAAPNDPRFRTWQKEALEHKVVDRGLKNDETIDGNVYRHRRYGFEMTFPEGWSPHPEFGDSAITFLAPGPNEFQTPRLRVWITDNPEDINATFDQEKAKVQKLGWSVTRDSEDKKQINGTPAILETGGLRIGTYALRYEQISIRTNGRLYQITGLAPETDFEKYRGTFQTCIESVRMEALKPITSDAFGNRTYSAIDIKKALSEDPNERGH